MWAMQNAGSLIALTVFIALAMGFALWTASASLRSRWRRARIAAAPFPPAWRRMLQTAMPAWRRLPADIQDILRRHILIFVAEKRFIGADGLAISEEMKVLIAAQASLLSVRRGPGCFDDVREVLVYPGAFAVTRPDVDAAGVEHVAPRIHLGESSSRGQVVLAWDAVLAGAADPDDGHNVVLHEFAHQLDQRKGAANGAPSRVGAKRVARWAATMGAAYALLHQQVLANEVPTLDPYALHSPAEFFAVATENFFERPDHLARAMPAVYRELAGYYHVDPLSWH
ncbi:M90 family metallopeptidase [Methyloversatilis thermotolerans]|uniref:M90 family metallopeptidase n=1 Tax=Methyloversatilis thermotolerans TaxID=1346290 RepID=UPI0003663875|nr:M90 family metallopeptidase [Methyloversatilis thermotolerans]